jgi:PadR family transcriptional regulator, regulatory protein PadR
MGKIFKKPVGASASLIILSVLATGDNYGYEILQIVKELSGGRIKWNEGSIYPVLKKMVAHGMVKSYLIMGENERPRKYYSLLEPGKLELQAEIEEWYIVHDMLTKLWNSDK